MQKTSSITLVATPIKTTIWNCTSQTSAVKQWASDLSRVVSAGFKLQDLEMAGRAVLLEHDDIGLAQEYTHFVASEVGVQFVFISCETMLTIDTWLKWIPTDKPTLIYLEPGIWMSKDLSADDDNEWPLIPDFDEDKGISFRVQLINFITRQKLNRKCIFVTAVQTNAQIDTSLKRVGLFDRRIVISNLDYSSKASIFIDRVGIDKIDTSITSDLNRLGCLIHHVFPRSRQRELFYKAVQRLAWRKKGKINFKDLIIFATYGTSEADIAADPPNPRFRHAVHEAGHALLVHLDSRDKLPPEYCSVMKRGNSLGIVVRGFDDHEQISNDLSYCDIVHKVRVLLAGRAAEYILLGANEISCSGSTGDLEKATILAGDLFGYQGHSLNLASDHSVGSNLAICLGKPSPSEYVHLEALSRNFLNQQFQIVLKILRKNKKYLESIADKLNTETILFREDFFSILKSI